jgi:hypothetical protein
MAGLAQGQGHGLADAPGAARDERGGDEIAHWSSLGLRWRWELRFIQQKESEFNFEQLYEII